MEFDFLLAAEARFVEKSIELSELNGFLKCCKCKI